MKYKKTAKELREKEINKCGNSKCRHHTNDHSYNPESLDSNLECDKCDCKNFEEEIQKLIDEPTKKIKYNLK